MRTGLFVLQGAKRRNWLNRSLCVFGLVALFATSTFFSGCDSGDDDESVPKDSTSWELINTDSDLMPEVYWGEVAAGGQTIFACGDEGKFYKSTDAGLTWNTILVKDITAPDIFSMPDSGAAVRSFDFADAQNGVAGGDRSLFYTADGGANWTFVPGSFLLDSRIKLVRHVSGTAYGAITSTSFIKSNDNGRTWTTKNFTELDTTSYALVSFDFSNTSTAMLITSGPVYFTTTDGGTSWTYRRITSSARLDTFSYYCVAAQNETTFFICGEAGRIVKTSLTGSWATVSSAIASSYYLFAIDFAGNVGVAGGTAGEVTVSTDGGNTWTRTMVPSIYGDVTSVNFSADGSTATVTANDTYRGKGAIRLATANASSWTGVNFGTKLPLNSVVFKTANEGIFVSNESAIYKSYDGGNTILQRVFGNARNVTIADVAWKGSKAIAVGSQGNIIVSSDNGEHWGVLPSSAINTTVAIALFTRVQMIDENIAYAIGRNREDNAIVVKTTDGGASWNVTDLAMHADLMDLHFISATEGFVCGAVGTIMRTTDGGATWTPQSTPTNSGVYSIYFLNATKGWACGDNLIMRTTDGGTTWTTSQIVNNLSGVFNDIVFINENSGWIVGNYGYILHTIDGGETWYRQMSGITQRHLLTVFSLDATHVWTCGDAGVIMRLIP